MTESRSGRLLSASAIMASGTLVSRILGVIRVMLIAFVLGNGTMQADAFNLALFVPNSLYMLLAGGTLNNVLVPQIVRATSRDADQGKAFIDRIITGFWLVLAVLTLILTVAVPLVMAGYTDGSWQSPAMDAHWHSLLLMTYITMPQIFFYGIFFLIGQVLNARDVFGPMMWAPIANNLVSIGILGSYIAIWGQNTFHGAAFSDGQAITLAVGSTAGITIQMCLLFPFLKKAGISYRPRFDLKGTGLGRTFHIAKWMVGYVALTSLAQVVVTRLASGAVPQGSDAGAGVNVYQNGYLIWILPHSLITVSLVTAMLPAVSRLAAANDLAGVAQETMRTAKLAMAFIVPASVGFLVLADPITRILFGFGRGAADYHFVSWTLLAFAIGLIPYSLQYLYLRAFYALDDTKTPFFLQILISGANALLAVALVTLTNQPQTVAAWLAGSYSLAYFIGVFATHVVLRKRLPRLNGSALLQQLARLIIAALIPASLAWGINWAFAGFESKLLQIIGLVLAAGVALISYFAIASRMRIAEIRELGAVLRRRSARKSQTATGELSREAAESRGTTGARETTGAQETNRMHQETAAGSDGVALTPDGTATGGFGNVSPGITHSAAITPNGTAAAGAIPTLAARTVASMAIMEETARGLEEGTDLFAATDSVALESENADPDGVGVFIRFRAAKRPQAFPEPTAAIEDPGMNGAKPKQVLGGRFELIQALLESEPGAKPISPQPWLAFDETLERHVLVYLFDLSDSRVPAVLTAARKAANATDARILRVLDIGTPTQTCGAYLVYEYCPGQTLAAILRQGGKLRETETAWIVREVSDVQAVLSTQNLSHLRINPETVLITTNGNVKLTGLLVDEVLNPALDGGDDIAMLGRLLYAARTAHCFDSPAYGLAAAGSAPFDALGHSRVDELIRRMLGLIPTSLRSAIDVTTALSIVLGPVSAAQDLRSRLQLDAVPQSFIVPPLPVSPMPVPTDMEDEMTISNGTIPENTNPENEPTAGVPFISEAMDSAQIVVPVPPPAKPPKAEGDIPWRLLGIIWGVTLIGAILAAFLWPVSKPEPVITPPPVTASPTYVPKLVEIASIQDFDPKADGGDGAEKPKDVEKAYDENLKTAWKTERYKKKAHYDGLKPGTGLILNFGAATQIQRLEIDLVGDNTDLEIRIPDGEYSEKSQANWKRVLPLLRDQTGHVVIDLPKPVRAEYLLIYLTKLPEDGNYYRGGIAEIKVFG